MRILFVSASSGSRGGGEIFLLYLAAELKNLGHTVGLWIANHPRMDELGVAFASLGDVLRAPYVSVYDRWHRGLLGSLSPRTHSARWMKSWRDWQPDVIHGNKQCLEDGLDLLDTISATNIPHLATVHITQTATSLDARLGFLRDRRARIALLNYQAPLVAVARARGEALREWLGPTSDVRVIDNGVPRPPPATASRTELRRREGISPEAVAIVAVGRLEAQKNPLRFLHEIGGARKVQPQLHARWIGDGRLLAEWENAVASQRLGETVRLDRWRDDVARVLPAFDIFLHTAAFEGLPLALLEALHAGLPTVVAPEVHAQLPADLQGVVLPLTPGFDWTRLLTDLEHRQTLGHAGKELARTRYSTMRMANEYLAIYQQLCRP